MISSEEQRDQILLILSARKRRDEACRAYWLAMVVDPADVVPYAEEFLRAQETVDTLTSA